MARALPGRAPPPRRVGLPNDHTPLYESTVVVSVDDNTPVSQELGSILHSDRNEESRRERGARVDGRVHSRPFLEAIHGWTQPGGYMQNYWPVLSIALVLFATAVFFTLHVTVLKQDRSESVQPKP